MKTSVRPGLLLAGLLLLWPLLASAQSVPPQLRELDAFITAEMAKEQVPGLAIAVVKDGEVIYQRGFGHRDVARDLPVTVDTAFPIASVSKSFAVLTLGTLVQEGKLDWDRPVREYLPDFKLYEPESTALMTARDMVSHRSGLPRHDAVWYGATTSRQALWEGLRYLEPSAALRGRYQYNNLMYVAAGYLAGRLSGGTWEQLLQARLFDPLGMRDSTASIQGLRTARQPALGYVKDGQDNVVPKDYADIDAIAPAGAINSTLADMTRYLQMHLGNGALGGRRIVDAAILEQMRLPLIATDSGPLRDPEFSRSQYGMGLALNGYRGHRHVSHGGNIDGFTSFLSYLPEDGIGVVMLSNLNSSDLRNIIPYRIYDRLLGLPEIDWSGRLAERRARNKASEVQQDGDKRVAKAAPAPTLRRSGTRPSRPLDDFVGRYRHPAYGEVTIGKAADGRLTMAYHRATTPLDHHHYDVFRAPTDELNDLQRERVQFHTDMDGDVAELTVLMESSVPAIRFARQADPAMGYRGFLQAFAGNYQLGADALQVQLREDGQLVMVTGGRALLLRPVTGTRFAVEGQQSQYVEFQRDGGGAVKRMVQYQPWGERIAEKR